MHIPTFLSTFFIALTLAGRGYARAVFAHYMVGTMSAAHAHQDIDDAVAMGLDGFALNIGDPTQPFVRTLFNNIFDYTRDTYGGRFFLYFSLDVWASGAAGKGVYPTDDYHSLLQDFLGHAAYYRGPNGNPFVSTFSDGGLTNADWQAFKNEWGNSIYFVPDFDGTQGYYTADPGWWAYWGDVIDGLFSWESAWPYRAGYGGAYPGDIGPDKTVIAGTAAHHKTYMMALSALQYKDAYNTNLYRGGELNLPTRMQGILSMSPAPDFIQIITWNDGPESHYIGNLWPEQNTDVQPNIYATQQAAAHNGWRNLITSFINAYKAGQPASAMQPVAGSSVTGVMWYKTITQSTTCPNGGLGGYDAKPDGFDNSKDQLNWAIVVPSGATGYSVNLYSNFKLIQSQNLVGGLNYGAASSNVATGQQRMELLLNGNVIQVAKNGRCITDTCPDGTYNMNPQVVELTTDLSDGFCPVYYVGNYPGGVFFAGGSTTACQETSGMDAADMWNKFGATDVLNQYLGSSGSNNLDKVIDAAATGMKPSDSQYACTDLTGGVCGPSDACKNYDNKALWYIELAFGNLQIYLKNIQSDVIDATILGDLDSDKIVDTFSAPLKLLPNDNAKTAKILANIAGVFGMISPALGGIEEAVGSGVTGVFGGLIGMVGTDMPTSDGLDFTTQAKEALTARLSVVFKAYLNAIDSFAEAIWVAKTGGSIPPWLLDPTSSPPPQTNPLSVTQFFQDGRYMVPLVETAPIRDAIIKYTEQNLVGVVLASSDAYVLVNAHEQSACNFPGAAWLFGTCYSLEYPGTGGPAGASDKTSTKYSRPLPSSMISDMQTYGLYIPDVLDASELCQIHYGFGGQNDPTQSLYLGDLPACFYALPVIYVSPDGTPGSPWGASPCAVALGKQGTYAGHDQLPGYLNDVFTRTFCMTAPNQKREGVVEGTEPVGGMSGRAMRRAEEEREWNYEEHIKMRKAQIEEYKVKSKARRW